MRVSLKRAAARLALCAALCTTFWTNRASAEKWSPYLEFSGRAGGLAEVGQGNLFLPLHQSDDSLLFADLRGQWTDVASAEGNWGLAMRKIMHDDYILGAYGFYDLRHSPNGENYHQATLGAELLTREWGFRFNTYLPEDGVRTGINPNARLSGDSIIVSSDREAAYEGFDAEIESLLYGGQAWNGSDVEIWAAAAYYHFEHEASGFTDINGPRARVEMRMFDVPMLGNGSRIVVGAQFQDDDVRGGLSQATASVRIPIGPSGRKAKRLGGLDRRMITPVVRDIDVVTGGETTEELGRVATEGNGASSVVVVNSETENVNREIRGAGKNALIIVDGEVLQNQPIELRRGQTIAGGGSTITVMGTDSGQLTTLTLPGERGSLFANPFIGQPVDEFPPGDFILEDNVDFFESEVQRFGGPPSFPSILANNHTIIHGLDIYSGPFGGEAPMIVIGRGDHVEINQTNLYGFSGTQLVYAGRNSSLSLTDSTLNIQDRMYDIGFETRATREVFAGTVLDVDKATEFSMLRSEIKRIATMEDTELVLPEFDVRVASKGDIEFGPEDDVLYAAMNVNADKVSIADSKLSVSDVRVRANQLTATGNQFDGLTAFISKGDNASFTIQNNRFTGSKVRARTSDTETLELALDENEFDEYTRLTLKADDGTLIVNQQNRETLATSNGINQKRIRESGNVVYGDGPVVR